MKAIKLTPKEKELFDSLQQFEGGCLRQHIKSTNTVCFRLLDKEFRPIKNFRYGLVHQLEEKGIIELNKDHNYVLKATAEVNEFKNIGLVKDYQL